MKDITFIQDNVYLAAYLVNVTELYNRRYIKMSNYTTGYITSTLILKKLLAGTYREPWNKFHSQKVCNQAKTQRSCIIYVYIHQGKE